MRLRFWNASALAAGFVTASVLVPFSFGQGSRPAAAEKTPTAASAEKGQGRDIELKLAIAGLGSKGCDIDVKPGNPACVFKAQTLHVKPDGQVLVELKDVKIRGADRNCSIALTIREEGQPAKTVYRGYRLAAEAKEGAVESFLCCLSSPSKVAAIAATRTEATRR
ncbi:hypothetical protein [Planctomyces sp. SH-PL62]|uniref:hypothetical protein n=1 Tax=Planctomyces sp. SH-PL62 TaxID=1636152 RepID=UPI00078D53A0|nr:hypothetical protein [Planctomyces sp. SH-PL62]AMV36514.1 hypothetical protein VT85_03720 [Planctomyces sp. SH-PL62]